MRAIARILNMHPAGEKNKESTMRPGKQMKTTGLDQILLAKIVLTIAVLQYGLIPPIVDLTESHVFHSNWPGHARFHMVWLLCIGSTLAAYVLTLIWAPAANRTIHLKHASVLGCIVLAGFFAATLTLSSYGGTLSDPLHQILILGIDGNLVSFSVAGLLQCLGAFLIWRAP